ncbi:universal stress protein [Haladaptatus caseinilyticus]|uniref:universal stress protein n=1 Tax=Haladaptatus caseinilyticus TaxID=2993314 RepID=UPI00224B28BE|nr:universal stress protein [Haladaptatus caseinilyticus]
MYERILLPTDGSEASNRAIEQAMDLADTYDARLYAISVIDQSAIPPDVRADILYDELQRECERALKDIEMRASDAGIDVRTSIPQGTPYRAILDFADDHDIDLIVMGTHGRRGIDRYLLGSVTEKIVRLSDRPVLTVRMSGSS